VLDREGAETAQLYSVTLCHGARNLAEDRVDDILDIALIEMWILGGNTLDKLGLDH
jgi:hypothetical protein